VEVELDGENFDLGFAVSQHLHWVSPVLFLTIQLGHSHWGPTAVKLKLEFGFESVGTAMVAERNWGELGLCKVVRVAVE
jgi:hypothetical protein